MKNQFKLIAALLLVLSLSMTMFIGCKKGGEEVSQTEETNVQEEVTEETTEVTKSTDPSDMILDGRYVYSFFAEGYGDFASYFHFYEEAPVLGAVFYAAYQNNGTAFTGTYTVEKKDFEYALYNTRDEIEAAGEKTTGTAPYTITFYDWDGNVMDSCGFDGDILYNDMEVIKGMGGGPVIYTHDTDLENSLFKAIYEGEVGLAYLDFISDEDETSTVTLFHNMTYRDLMNMMIDGTWSMEKLTDGSFSYTLTPADESDSGAVLSVSLDNATAVYTQDGAEGMTLTNTKLLGPTLAYVFEGVQTITQYSTDAPVTLTLYDDGTCFLTADLFGNSADVDAGTYVMAADGYTFEFSFDKGGEFKSLLDSSSQDISLNYIYSTEKLGDFDTVLILNKEAAASTSEAEILFSFTGNSTTFDCFTDNTYVFKFESYSIEERGTWAFDAATYSFSITQDNGNVIAASIVGDAHDLTFEYVAVASDKLKDTFTATADVWSAALMK